VRAYAVNLVSDDNGTLLVTVPDLPEAVTFREEALAIDAIERALAALGRSVTIVVKAAA
jgi:hypothetical protein